MVVVGKALKESDFENILNEAIKIIKNESKERTSKLVSDELVKSMVKKSGDKTRPMNDADSLAFIVAYACVGKILDKIEQSKNLPLDAALVGQLFVQVFQVSVKALADVIQRNQNPQMPSVITNNPIKPA